MPKNESLEDLVERARKGITFPGFETLKDFETKALRIARKYDPDAKPYSISHNKGMGITINKIPITICKRKRAKEEVISEGVLEKTLYTISDATSIPYNQLELILRYPIENKIKRIYIKKEDSRYKTILKLPLETLLDFKNNSVHIISKSNIAIRTGKGNFQKGTIRNYISDDDQENRHLLLRDPLYFSIQKLRNELFKSLINFFMIKGFTWVAPSILTKATEACEDISGLFWTHYQNKETRLKEKVALAQTAQLHLEAMCPAYGNLFSIAPSFRHEKGQPTTKHLLEYWHVEVELVNRPLIELMDFVEEMLKYSIRSSLKECPAEIEIIKDTLKIEDNYFKKILKPYTRMSYDQVIKKLNQQGKVIQYGDDINSESERMISKDSPIFVYNWPDKLKAFYFTRFKQNGKNYVKSFDLIGFNHGEIVGGGEREYRLKKFKYFLDRQVEVIKAHGHNPKDYKYYEDLRMIGSIPHSGFGMGLERALSFLYNLKDVRMASLFPRDQKRIYP